MQTLEKTLCCNCGQLELFAGAYFKHAGDYFCNDCVEKLFFTCEKCSDLYSNDEQQVTPENELFCEGCYNETYSVCEDCNEIVHYDASHYAQDCTVCDDCFRDNYDWCAGCDEAFHSEYIYYSEYTERIYCESCYNEVEEERRCNSIIQDCDYVPDIIFHKFEWENTLFQGLEIEMERVNGCPEEAMIDFFREFNIEHDDSQLYCKEDGSIRNGVELVTQPMTLLKHKQFEWRDKFEWLTGKGMRAHDTGENGRCGLHVHANKNFFTNQRDINKIHLFFTYNLLQLQQIDRRKRPTEDTDYAVYNFYHTHDYVGHANSMSGAYSFGEKYIAVNVKRKTVEFRMFRGTLKYETFMASIEFVNAICYFVIQHSFMAMSWQHFITWLEAKKEYSFLPTYLKSKGVM